MKQQQSHLGYCLISFAAAAERNLDWSKEGTTLHR